MLPGQDFGGCHQRGLVLVRDRYQQGVDGDRGLAGADVGLEQPLHGARAGQVEADFADRLILVGRQLERQQPANAVVDLGGAGHHRGGLLIAQVTAAQCKGGLKHQELFVGKAPPSDFGLFKSCGHMDIAKGGVQAREMALAQQPLGNDVDRLRSEVIDGGADESAQGFRAQVFGHGINRHDAGRRVRRVSVEGLPFRVGHLPVISVPLGFAGEGHALAIAELAADERLIEPGALQRAAAAVVDDDADDSPAVGQPAPVDLDDLALDHLRLAGFQIVDGADGAEVFIVAGKMQQQIGDGGDAETLKLLAASGIGAFEGLEVSQQGRFGRQQQEGLGHDEVYSVSCLG